MKLNSNIVVWSTLLFGMLPLTSCGQKMNTINQTAVFAEMNQPNKKSDMMQITDTATFAAGCFWCVETQFQQLDGVIEVESGYT